MAHAQKRTRTRSPQHDSARTERRPLDGASLGAEQDDIASLQATYGNAFACSQVAAAQDGGLPAAEASAPAVSVDLGPDSASASVAQEVLGGTATLTADTEGGPSLAFESSQSAGMEVEGSIQGENQYGSASLAGSLSAEAQNTVSGQLDAENASVSQAASVGATAAATLEVRSAPVTFQVGDETLGAEAYGRLEGSVGASASDSVAVTVLAGGKVSPALNAEAKAFVGAEGSATLGASLWWQKKGAEVYQEGALVLLEKKILPDLPEEDAARIRQVLDGADRLGLLDEIAGVIMGDAGQTDLATVEGEVTGHAGAGAEGKLNLSAKDGMVLVDASVGAAVGIGASAGATVGVDPVDAGRLLLVLLSQGDAVEAQLKWLLDKNSDLIKRASECATSWAIQKLRALNQDMEAANPAAYEASQRESQETAAAVQELIEDPSLAAGASVVGNSVQGLFQSGVSAFSWLGSTMFGGKSR